MPELNDEGLSPDEVGEELRRIIAEACERLGVCTFIGGWVTPLSESSCAEVTILGDYFTIIGLMHHIEETIYESREAVGEET
jgi:hypothetical protein